MTENLDVQFGPLTEDGTSGIPESVVLAAVLTSLDAFLEDVSAGFHWQVLDQLVDGVYLVDRERRIKYWSRGAERLTGFSARQVLGSSCADGILLHVDDAGKRLCEDGCPIHAVMADGQPREADVFLHHRHGHRVPVHVRGWPIRNQVGAIIGAFEVFSDMTERTGDLERIQKLQEAAYRDALTGLANRRFAESVIEGRLREYEKMRLPFGLIVCDIDRFKQVNDAYGHDAGDSVLRTVAQTIQNACRSYDLAARWGGEEFVIVTGSRVAEVNKLAEVICALVQTSRIRVGSDILTTTVSCGAAMVQCADDVDSLFRRADQLMYASKRSGGNRVSVESGEIPACQPHGCDPMVCGGCIPPIPPRMS